jgi:hypothetical protein
MGLKQVDELGELVERRWHATDYDPHLLPEIAVTALRDANLPKRLLPDEIITWALATPELPPQVDPEGKFGQPPVTLYRGGRFYIEALHWVDGSTTVHQHAFSGAFQVLAGSSIETQYAFDVGRRFDGHFVLGTLRPLSSALHTPGDVIPIKSGPTGLIHGLFHLERPSITIVVRTFHDADAGPQFNFTRNGIGADPFFLDTARDRALQLIGLLRQLEHPGLEKLVGKLVKRSDAHTAFRVLEKCATLPDRELFDRLVACVSERDVGERFRDAFQEAQRLAFLYSRRSHVKDPSARFFLGVLLTARNRQDALELVQARRSVLSAPEQAAAWLRQLSNVSVRIQAGGSPWEPNVLGIPEMTDELESALARELSGWRGDRTIEERIFLEKMRSLSAFACLFN